MLKKLFVILGITLAAAGCQGNDQGSAMNQDADEFIDMKTERQDGDAQNPVSEKNYKEGQYGYVRHQELENTEMETNQQEIPSLDKEQTADIISRLVVRLPNIEDAATLVTDEEVFVAYRTEAENRKLSADQVKQSAISIVPRFYHVYISDEQGMIQNIERFQNSSPNSPNIENLLDHVKQEMKQSPQGRKISDGENENGEQTGERNEKINNFDEGEKE